MHRTPLVATVTLALVLLGSGCQKAAPGKPPSSRAAIAVGTATVYVEVAKDSATQERGLSGREGLKGNAGMLFDYTGQQPRVRTFWMRGMRFDLDLVWIRDGRVVGLTEAVPAPKPEDPGLPLYSSPEPVDQVLEVPSGWVKQNRILVGDPVVVAAN